VLEDFLYVGREGAEVLVLVLILESVFGGERGHEEEDTRGDGMGCKLDTLGRRCCAHHGHDERCPRLLEMTREDKGSDKEQGGEQRAGVARGWVRGLGRGAAAAAAPSWLHYRHTSSYA
jgi:hypothetical protein